MPYCPNCGEEYDEGMSACAVCGSDLVDAHQDQDGSEGLENFEAVFIGPLPRALVLRSLLESEGIVVSLQGEEESHASPSLSDAVPGPVKLFVPADSAEAALEIVESAGTLETPAAACGEVGPEDGLDDPFAFPLPGDAEETGSVGGSEPAAPVPGNEPAAPAGRKPAGGARKKPAKAAKGKAKAARPSKKSPPSRRTRKP